MTKEKRNPMKDWREGDHEEETDTRPHDPKNYSKIVDYANRTFDPIDLDIKDGWGRVMETITVPGRTRYQNVRSTDTGIQMYGARYTDIDTSFWSSFSDPVEGDQHWESDSRLGYAVRGLRGRKIVRQIRWALHMPWRFGR